MNKIKFLIIIILGFFGLFAISYAAPSFRIERSIIPEQSARFFLGTTTPSTTAWLGVITDELCLTGDVCRTTWPTGGSGTYSFTPTIIGGTEHSASTTRPFYFGQGLLAASSTLGYLNVGYINATSSTASTFAGGVTITCTGCVTDINVADIALGGGTSGNYIRTLADSGNSTITVTGSGAEDADVTLNVIDVNCTNCLGATEIDETFNWTGTLDGYEATQFFGFTPQTIGGTIHMASSSRPFNFGSGVLTASTTAGVGVFGSLTSTSSASFLNGLTITCTDCVTDANVADLAVGGDVTGTLSAIAVTDNSHAHDSTTISGIDISADTNLTATFPIVLTGDTLSFGWAYPFIGNATSSVLTFSSAPIFSSLTGVLKGNGASALTVAADGTDFSLIDALTCTGTDKFSAVTADGTFTCSTDVTGGAGGSNPFSSLTVGGTVYQATTSPLYFSGGFLTGTSTIGTLTATSTITGLNGLTISGGSVDFPNGSIANADLANSTITFGNGTCATGSGSTALGGTGTVSVTSNCTDAATLDSIEGASLLRSDASDSFTSGTLTFDASTILTLAAGTFVLPNGTAPVVDAVGEIGLDTTDNQLIVATSTLPVGVIRTKVRLYGYSVASTTLSLSGFVAGQIMPLSPETDGFTMYYAQCNVWAGTSVTINFTDAGGNDTNSLVCDTATSTQRIITTNNNFTAGEGTSMEISAVSGTVNRLNVSIFGVWTRE